MWPKYIFIFLCTITYVNAIFENDETPEVYEPGDLARGWGNGIDWVPLDKAYEVAAEKKKPLFILFHKTWCAACKALKKVFPKAKELARLSRYFVMVNLMDDEEPTDEVEYQPDGNYIPRILFFKPSGTLLEQFMNPKPDFPDSKYYYSNPGPIIKSMKAVMKELGIKEIRDEL